MTNTSRFVKAFLLFTLLSANAFAFANDAGYDMLVLRFFNVIEMSASQNYASVLELTSNETTQHFPISDREACYRAEALYQTGHYLESATLLSRFSEPPLLMAKALYQLNLFEAAIALLKTQPVNEETLLWLALSLDASKKSDEAISLLKSHTLTLKLELVLMDLLLKKQNEEDRLKTIARLHEIQSDPYIEFPAKEEAKHLIKKAFLISKQEEEACSFSGKMLLNAGKINEAIIELEKFLLKYPGSSYTQAVLLDFTLALELQKAPVEKINEIRHQIIAIACDTPIAAQAEFELYPLKDYLKGEKKSVKHLKQFHEKHLNSPYRIVAYYLEGLDWQQNRKSPEGRWIRKKNLFNAIECFSKCEETFEKQLSNSQIPASSLSYYTQLYWKSILERASVNVKIAEESHPTKQKIYLQYAADVYKGFKEKLGPIKDNIEFSSALSKSVCGYSKVMLKLGEPDSAELALVEEVKRLEDLSPLPKSPLFKIKFLLGKISLEKSDPSNAYQQFKEAETIAEELHLKADEKLDLWIEQSLCMKAQEKYDHSMKLLSKVINDDSISTLRLKAMWLRADLYEKQGRSELARKQLESLAQKGGAWAEKAKNALIEMRDQEPHSTKGK